MYFLWRRLYFFSLSCRSVFVRITLLGHFGQQLRELNLTPMPVSGPRNSNLRLCLTLARKRMALPTESDHSGRRLGSENLI